MRKKRGDVRRERLLNWYERDHPFLDLIADALILVFTIFTTWVSLHQDSMDWVNVIPFFVIALLVLIYKIFVVYLQCKRGEEYEVCQETNKLSIATLRALKNANKIKRRYILQSTYGRVPQWHPVDYTKNILVYDVHEQIRSILLELQRVILDTCGELNSDQITVDFAYCYPSVNKSGGKLSDDSRKTEKAWRLITSGNHSLGGSMQYFLSNERSFYSHIEECGYCFYNDKMECIRNGHYLVSDKDRERNSDGSIIGLKIELRNDEPEAVFVEGILTITTYGKKIYEKEKISEKEFEEIFKENVLNSFKLLIQSELAQMFIRHAILEGNMCPKTGKVSYDTDEQETECSKACAWTGKKCKFCKCDCNCRNLIKGQC